MLPALGSGASDRFGATVKPRDRDGPLACIQGSPHVRTRLCPANLLPLTGRTINCRTHTEWVRSPPLRVEPTMSSSPSLILVVEDDPNQQELMQMTLQRIGVTEPIHCVGGGTAAIAYLQGEERYADRARFPYPTLIITDLQMSAGDGYALLLHLQNHPTKQHCPIVVFSSLDDEEHIAQARQLGASAYIVKPMTFADTCHELRALFPQKAPA